MEFDGPRLQSRRISIVRFLLVKRFVVFSLQCSVHVLKNTRTFARYHLKPLDFEPHLQKMRDI